MKIFVFLAGCNFLFRAVQCSMNLSHFQILEGKISNNVFQNFHARSIIGCAGTCALNANGGGGCASATYERNTGECGLSADVEGGLVDVNDVTIVSLLLHDIPAVCPVPTPLLNGSYDVSGDVVTYACNPGFTLSGVPTVTCVNGAWTGAVPNCDIVDCGPVPYENTEVVNGTMCTHTGCSFHAHCAPGFKGESGSATSVQMTCNGVGTWEVSPAAPDCSYELMFRGTAENGYNISAAYLDGNVVDGVTSDVSCMDVHDASCTLHYRNSRIDTWETLGLTRVLYELYEGGATVMSVLLNATGSNTANWMGEDSSFRAISWPWTEVTPTSTTWWSVKNDIQYGRIFRILKDYVNCDDAYYSVVVYPPVYGCSYETHATYPRLLYTLETYATNFNTAVYGQASSLGVWVK